MRAIDYTKAAYAVYSTLDAVTKAKADKLINAFADENGLIQPILANKLSKVVGELGEDIYSIRLSHKLRILAEKQDNRILIIDILNHDLFVRYFHNSQAA